MRDRKRIGVILNKLGDLWQKAPDWRLGQLMYNINRSNSRGSDSDIFNLEDEELEKLIDYLDKDKG